MRLLLASALALLTAAGAGCSTPCQELGYKLCECRNPGTSKTTCENTVDDELEKNPPTSGELDACEAALKTCDAPSGVAFCTWLDGEDGKRSCGLVDEG